MNEKWFLINKVNCKYEHNTFLQNRIFLLFQFCLSLGVLICLNVISIETLDLDTKKKLVSTVEKISTVLKS